ncbi:anti-sigma factor domain-containing protein [Candidatus Bathyarchaeota archaeon]|nr:anti-sigma factor domain-containing protein [Candidatus Bathyarchaeota archaeon]
MKASVIEIYKNYCIVITRDGRFVRQDMPVGACEIGDEIVIEAADLFTAGARPARKSFGMLARLSVGFAAIDILSGGAYLGINYAGPGFAFSPVKAASQVAQAKITDSQGQDNTNEGYAATEQSEEALAEKAPASESDIAAVQSLESSADAAQSEQSSSTSNQDIGQSEKTVPSQDSVAATAGTNGEGGLALSPGKVLFEGTFKLEKNNIDILIDYPDLLIIGNLGQAYNQDAGADEIGVFTLKIKNLQKSTFIGKIDIIFTDKNGSNLQTTAIETGILGFNDVYTQQISIAANADSFKITLYGSFDET